MSAVYGYEPSPRNDPLVQLVGHAVHFGMAVLTPERAMMLKTFPFCEFYQKNYFVHVLLNSCGIQY
jgi:hypothetical protein